MDQIFGKSKFSWKVTDLGRFGALNRSGVFAGAISMPAAPRPGWGPGPPRRRIEITPAIYFLENYNCDREICCMFVGVHLVS